MDVAFKVEDASFLVVKLSEVDRREVASGVIEEHVFRTWVRRIDATVSRARVPLVDRGVVLKTRIGAVPSRFAQVVPKSFCRDGLDGFFGRSSREIPGVVLFNCFKKGVADSDRVVGILTGNGEICL